MKRKRVSKAPRASAAVEADRLVACRACGAAFGEPCTPRERPNRAARRADKAKPAPPGTISCFGRRMRRLLAFRGMGDDPVGWLLAECGPGGSREEVISVLRERAEANP